MYEVFLKSWYQESPNETQEEVMHTTDNIEDAFIFLKNNADYYIEFYPLEEMGVRIKKINKELNIQDLSDEFDAILDNLTVKEVDEFLKKEKFKQVRDGIANRFNDAWKNLSK